ncbi:MAG: Gfo/Idh/MocA family oxidoreductase [Gemmatimonadaceae bacterium]
MRFALIGAAGFVATRHMRAIRELGHQLVAALDPHDSVGILDSLAPGCRFFPEPERFSRHLDKLRRSGQGVDYVSVCSPNYLHDAHCRLAMRAGADVICEKPLVLSPWNLDALAELEHETGRRVWTVLQLRVNPALIALREKLRTGPRGDASLYYSTPRGPWYGSSWKGDEARSGGVLANVGVHLFDLLLWLYGPARTAQLTSFSPTQASGVLQHDGMVSEWLLSLDGAESKRMLTMPDGCQDLSDGFKDAHTVVYAETLAGRGFGIEDARPAVDLVHALRSQRGRL